MSITAPETTLESLDSGALKDLLARTDKEVSTSATQITALENRIAAHHEKQAELAALGQQGSHRLGELAKELAEVQSRHDLAQTARTISAGTPAAGVAAQHAQHWEAQLCTLTQEHETAAKQASKQEASVKKEQETVLEALSQDEIELVTLKRQAQHLKKSRESTHSALGQATFRELSEKIQQLGEYERALTMVLEDTRVPILQLQHNIPKILSEWPDLLQKAQRIYGKEREKTETERLLETYLAFLRELEKLSQKGTKYDDEQETSRLLAFGEHDMRLALNAFANQGVHGNVGQRIRNVEGVLREEQQRASRGW